MSFSKTANISFFSLDFPGFYSLFTAFCDFAIVPYVLRTWRDVTNSFDSSYFDFADRNRSVSLRPYRSDERDARGKIQSTENELETGNAGLVGPQLRHVANVSSRVSAEECNLPPRWVGRSGQSATGERLFPTRLGKEGKFGKWSVSNNYSNRIRTKILILLSQNQALFFVEEIKY